MRKTNQCGTWNGECGIAATVPHSPFPIHQASRLAPRASRPGISLLEVLISMFVLLFGLMGVAAVFPLGNHYAARGDQYDRGAAMADAAFADLKARGILQPSVWMYAEAPPTSSVMLGNDWRISQSSGIGLGQFNITPVAPMGPGHAFVIDPMGIAAKRAIVATPNGLDVFPYAKFDSDTPDGLSKGGNGASNTDTPLVWRDPPGTPKPAALTGQRWPLRRVTLPSNNFLVPTMTPAVAASICALHDDLGAELPEEGDQPGIQRWRTLDRNPQNGNANNTPDIPADDTALARAYGGNYTWLATVVPTTRGGQAAFQPAHARYGSELYDVSVAVFYKRVAEPAAETERAVNAQLKVGGELIIYSEAPTGNAGLTAVDVVDAATRDIRPGQWIALAGVHPTTGQCLLKWYRLLSLDDETDDAPPANTLLNVTGTFAVRRAMLEGPDWPAPITSAETTAQTITNLRAILLPGVIGVSTQTLPLEDRSRTNTIPNGMNAQTPVGMMF
jgi:hypothetical protein